MATVKVTITLPEDQVDYIRKRVPPKEATGLSGFIQRAVQTSLEFPALVDEALAAGGGPVTPKERAWARTVLRTGKPGTKRNKQRTAA